MGIFVDDKKKAKFINTCKVIIGWELFKVIVKEIPKQLGYEKIKPKPEPKPEPKYDFFGRKATIPDSAIKVDPMGDPVLTKTQEKFEKAKKTILGNLTPGRQQLDIEYLAETDEYTIDSP